MTLFAHVSIQDLPVDVFTVRVETGAKILLDRHLGRDRHIYYDTSRLLGMSKTGLYRIDKDIDLSFQLVN